ncbi:dihydropteroate synthase [Liquorilactobacillus uvarum]|uniref:Dihydropteroate synthase n=1 Tax=Liquorilactobacillus uvarum DSM 19971 TaxID=1423812 RepID=A0A0R1Q7B6_9LACO|nr:dihydropteroate synthase [Liquorilactobacillus uvarum]KRL37203.1 dihydropteroate synthase [Liquorilactobacillus uvarum DSM 19971]
MIIKEAEFYQKSKFTDQISIEFNGTSHEIKKLIILLVEVKAKFSVFGEKVIAVTTRMILEQLLSKWSTVFETDDGSLRRILQDSRILFKGNGFSFDITTDPLIYSILNITPDSFYDGGVNTDSKTVLKKIEREIQAGASIFELGGKSSKPSFADISADEEWARIAPYIKEIKKAFPDIILALDSNTDAVVERALDEGIQIINDIDGFVSKKKLELINTYKPAVVTMFNGRNNPENNKTFQNDLKKYFINSIEKLKKCGLATSNIVIDPGVGFSNVRVLEFDLLKMKSIKTLSELNIPIMIAVSRKSFTSKLFDLKEEERLIPTLLFENYMVQYGGRILRVHDVKETKEMIDIYKICRQKLELG